MNKRHYQTIIFLNIIVFLLNVSCTRQNQVPEGKIKHVFVIGIDGMSCEGLKKAQTPNMDMLIQNGALCDRVRTVLPSSSSPNWASMLMGAGPEIHGIISNEWQVDKHDLDATVTNDYGYFPTVLSAIRAQRPEAKIGMLYHWKDFGRLFEKELASFNRHFPTEKATAYAIADYIKKEKPDFLFSQLDHVDAAGHRFGHLTPEYFNSISRADSLVGIIMDAVREAKIENETMIFVVSDHGGVNKGHGGTDLREVTVPFILSGAGVKKNYHVPIEVYIYDVAPTIVFALNLKEHTAWRGKAIKCAFENIDAPQNHLN
jgi:predicted AlkP superfamily pyrophosphatase or phosphodiesterase